MVKINRSTLHMVYKVEQSATQDSNDMTHRLSRRTAATNRFSPEVYRLPEIDSAKVLPTSDQVGLYHNFYIAPISFSIDNGQSVKMPSVSAAMHNSLHWLSYSQRVTYKLCFLTYKCLHGVYLSTPCFRKKNIHSYYWL